MCKESSKRNPPSPSPSPLPSQKKQQKTTTTTKQNSISVRLCSNIIIVVLYVVSYLHIYKPCLNCLLTIDFQDINTLFIFYIKFNYLKNLLKFNIIYLILISLLLLNLFKGSSPFKD